MSSTFAFLILILGANSQLLGANNQLLGANSQFNDTGEEIGPSVQICKVCSCGEVKSEDGEVILNIQCSELDRVSEIPDLNRIDWPRNPNGLRTSASFERLGLTLVESLPHNGLIDELSLANNLITTTWPVAFGELPALRKLSFCHNQLSQITQDMFSKLNSLEELDLSYNQLTEFNKLDFVALRNLRKLTLQNNMIQKLPFEAFRANKKLEDLDLSQNMIVDVDFKNGFDVLKTVKRLNLSWNNITAITTDMFPENKLEILDLSNNAIGSVDESAFYRCLQLRELNLASNQIFSPFTVPATVLSVTVAGNRLKEWPKFPPVITHLDISYNELYGLYDQNYADFDQLQILKISGNQLDKFELTMPLPKLFALDLSYNTLQEIPRSIKTEMLPALSELRLDGNPIEIINFQEKISIRSLFLNELNQVTSLNENAFSNVEGRNESDTGRVQLFISHCPFLEMIHEFAFKGSPLCLLDISYNNLTNISENLFPWDSLKEGLNLQGNPWDCSCEMQWLLDNLLPKIHERYPHYLTELRCETPRARQGLRMVHWLNWDNKILCTNGYRPEPNQAYMMESEDSSIKSVPTLTLILASSIIVSIVVVIALSTYLVRLNNRRYRIMRARRRQSAQDRQSANNQAEQFKALNKT